MFDFNLIKKEYKKLKVPKEYYNPLGILSDSFRWSVILSDRSRGKTTNLLLLGLILNKLYGTEIQYIRSIEEMITPKNSKNLFDVIKTCGYVKKLTDGRYNSIKYDRRRWYYCNIEDNEITDVASTPICTMLSIDKNEVYKSSYNAPNGDFILFDEFISKWYRPNEFIDFVDLVKTIARDRNNVIITLSANSIDKNSPYFKELELRKELLLMSRGSKKIVKTSLGTSIFIEILGEYKKDNIRQKINTLYYGFKNPKLSSVTGTDTWAFNSYPHIKSGDHDVLNQNHYILYYGVLLRLDLCTDNEQIFVNVHNATKTYNDSIIYTLDDITSRQYRYGLGYTKLDKLIWSLYSKNLFFYQSNDIGDTVSSFYRTCKKGL